MGFPHYIGSFNGDDVHRFFQALVKDLQSPNSVAVADGQAIFWGLWGPWGPLIFHEI